MILTNPRKGFRINRKENTMSETRGIVRCIFGFLLAILVIAGGAFGLDVKVNIEDAEPATSEVVGTDEVETTTEETDVSATDEVVDTEQSTVDSTPTEDEEASADESVDEEVTEPTDEEQDTVTEKGEN